jgi:hydroxymethylglutaryl-CoA lyase
MQDAEALSRWAVESFPNVDFCALVPNLKGAQKAQDCGLKEVSCVLSVSAAHNRANINRTHEESFAALADMQEQLPGLRVVPALCTAFGCPFEGEQPKTKVMDFVGRLAAMGFTSLELADTIGAGDPVRVADIFSSIKKEYPQLTLMAHLHDTRNNGIANSWAAMQAGADILHSALGGLGGCPFAPGASGNTSTEDLVWLLERAGVSTGINFEKIAAAAKKMHREISGNYSGHQIHLEKDIFCK